jgi:hypothetical protein
MKEYFGNEKAIDPCGFTMQYYAGLMLDSQAEARELALAGQAAASYLVSQQAAVYEDYVARLIPHMVFGEC